MSTSARIHFEGDDETAYTRSDGYHEDIARDVKAFLAETGAPEDIKAFHFITVTEERRKGDYPKRLTFLNTQTGVAKETVFEYEPKYELEPKWEETFEVNHEYTVTVDGRLFAGKELT